MSSSPAIARASSGAWPSDRSESTSARTESVRPRASTADRIDAPLRRLPRAPRAASLRLPRGHPLSARTGIEVERDEANRRDVALGLERRDQALVDHALELAGVAEIDPAPIFFLSISITTGTRSVLLPSACSRCEITPTLAHPATDPLELHVRPLAEVLHARGRRR